MTVFIVFDYMKLVSILENPASGQLYPILVLICESIIVIVRNKPNFNLFSFLNSKYKIYNNKKVY